ncbi:hypothetical protein [Aestuariicoccus sp. MJ-SS9]|uniref:hypothetical protein n=1 Tax=Aestuariicoccus sp. MJ-SS9 TaxID=3079855 RepID=UPI00290FD5AF|nr:hypothetical protein [Aestuariicoccus sp. MJ-SS9]MDU8913508.1 hypothetical protein [Aestuariicoccus sp. MJ-SS9]
MVRALGEFEAGTAPPSDEEEDLTDQITEVRAILTEMPMSARNRRTGMSLIARLQKARNSETAQGGRRHRLLKRYWREARAQRKRAFHDWLPCLRAQRTSLSASDKMAKIPKQSQISA